MRPPPCRYEGTVQCQDKRRESFRPAPSVLEEALSEWFEEEDAVPFMMQVFQNPEGKRKLIPRLPTWTAPAGCRLCHASQTRGIIV